MVYTCGEVGSTGAGPVTMTPETFLGYLSALHWVAPHLWAEPHSDLLPILLGTTATLHACDGIMCRLFAHNNGYPERLWMLIGFAFGIWAVAVLILLPRRARSPGLSATVRDPVPGQHAPHA